jgi:hypothetical protein
MTFESVIKITYGPLSQRNLSVNIVMSTGININRKQRSQFNNVRSTK